MSTQTVENILIGLVVIALLLRRQLTSHQVSADSSNRMMLILGVIGLVQAANYLRDAGRVSAVGVAAVVVSLAIGAALAFARANTVKIWRQDDVWWRRGTALTLVLWAASIGSHLGIDYLASALSPRDGQQINALGNATLVLYLAVALGLQQIVLQRRVARAALDSPFASPMAGTLPR